MRISFIILTIFTAFLKGAYGIKPNVNHQILGKRQTADTCVTTCDTIETYVSQCSSQAGSASYAGCICSNQVVQAITSCINCAAQYSSQSEVTTVESTVNSYINACAELGYPISVCSIDFSTGATQLPTTSNDGTITATIPILFTTSSVNPVDGLSIDPAELSLLSSLLGATDIPLPTET